MHVESIGLQERPFRSKGRPTTFIRYRSQQEAFKFLRKILTEKGGVGLLHGPALSGKSTILDRFVQELPQGQAAAIVNGGRLKTPEFLSEILAQFGYDVTLTSGEEMLNMLTVFLTQQTRSGAAPLLILENINEMYPSALGAICRLAELKIDDQYAVRIVLVCNRDYRRIIGSQSMRPIAIRLVDCFELEPMSAKESIGFLYGKLREAGARRPDDIFCFEICDRLFTASEGWPGRLDDIAMTVLEQASGLPIKLGEIDHPSMRKATELPQLIVTRDGLVLQEVELVSSRALIGRADLSDIVLDDQFVSKQHALLVYEEGVVILVDLNSANGTTVNSRRVKRTVLRNNDIVVIGDHRIKVLHAASPALSDIEDPDLADTAKMQSISDARRAKFRREANIASPDQRKA